MGRNVRINRAGCFLPLLVTMLEPPFSRVTALRVFGRANGFSSVGFGFFQSFLGYGSELVHARGLSDFGVMIYI